MTVRAGLGGIWLSIIILTNSRVAPRCSSTPIHCVVCVHMRLHRERVTLLSSLVFDHTPSPPPPPLPLSLGGGSWKTLPSMLQSAVGEETAGAAPLEERSTRLHTSHVFTSETDTLTVVCLRVCRWDEPSDPGNTVG